MSDPKRRYWSIAFCGYIAVLASISAAAYLKLLPRDSGLLALPHADHVIHFLLLGGASFFSHRALGGRSLKTPWFKIPIGPLIIGAVSIVDECVQAFVPWRTFDLLDMASNLSGVIVFGAIAEALIRRSITRPSALSPGAPMGAPSPSPQPAQRPKR